MKTAADDIMSGLATSLSKVKKDIGDKALGHIQRYCDDAQITMINRHIPRMTITERRRAEMVKAGIYHGQAIK